MEPIEYVRLFRRRWRLLAACVVIAGAVAWITTPANPAGREVTYEATHTLLRDDSSPTPPPALAQISLFVRTGDVPRRVAERVGFDGNPGILAQRVEVEPEETSGSLDITASGGSPEEAAELANAFAEETLAFFGERAQTDQTEALDAANAEVSRLQAEIDDLEEQIARAGDGPTARLEAQRDAKVRQYGVALDEQTQLLNQPPPTAGYLTLSEALPELAGPKDGGFETPRSRTARTAIALILGLALGVAAVLVAERFDPRIHTREAAAEAFGLPVVAEIPKMPVERGKGPRSIALVESPMSATAEAYRTLRASILLTPVKQLGHTSAAAADRHDEPQVVLVTSPAPAEGKTTTVANLAAAFAETGRSVLILSCDFRRPEIHRFFGADQSPGLSSVLNQTLGLNDVIRETTVPGVCIAADGGGLRRLGDLAAEGHELIARSRQYADIVLVDTAPALATNDASELIHAVDSVVVVCRNGATTTDSARRARVLLERLGTPVVGVALVGVADAESSYANYYTPDPEPQHRAKLTLRRDHGDQVEERLRPWQVTQSGLPPRGGDKQDTT